MARTAVGGFQQEANTFAPSRADDHAFEAGGGGVGISVGPFGPVSHG
jgi:microcystin degradation protein MlrC